MSDTLCAKIFRSEILSMSAYKVADAKNLIKLDAMENPYTWPEDIKAKWLEKLKSCEINRYPDPESRILSDILRDSYLISAHLKLLLGNGSDEIIQILLSAMPTYACVMAPEPSFVMYKQIALSMGLNYVGVPLLANNFELDLSTFLLNIEKFQPNIIFLAYPNNPTGNLFNAKSIEEILKVAPGLVVIDEAYAPFTSASFMYQLAKYENLLVMRTLSKLGLAGLRLGFLVGSEELLSELNKIRLPYNINTLTQLTATFALENSDFLLKQTQSICEERSILFNKLSKIEQIQVYPSEANFILFKMLIYSAQHIFDSLKQQGVLIKNLSHIGGLMDQCLRVTLGKPEENQAFLIALEKAIFNTSARLN